MTIFRVENVKSRFVFGDYEADNEQHALDVYAQDAGYRNFAHAREIAPVEDDEIVATRQTQPTSESAGYIVYQSCCAVFGTGDTLDAAKIDAERWMDQPEPDLLESLPRGDNGEISGEFYYLPATATLIAAVKEHGGDIAWHTVNGIAVTQSEYDESLSQ